MLEHQKMALKSRNTKAQTALQTCLNSDGSRRNRQNDGFVEARTRFWREMMVSSRRERDFGDKYEGTDVLEH